MKKITLYMCSKKVRYRIMNNWAYNLDMLAQNGVLDFDAPSFITGQAPRYVGAPSAPPSPYVGPPYIATPQLQQPEVDEFKKEKTKLPPQEGQDKTYVKNPTWKKVLFGAIALTTIGVGIWKGKAIGRWVKNAYNNLSWQKTKDFFVDKGKTFGNWVKKPFSKLSWQKTKDFFVDKGKAIVNFFKNCWNKFTGLFKKKP